MGPLLFALLLLSQDADSVRTRDGREIPGLLREYDRFVELEQPDGRLRRVPRPDILSLHPAPSLLSPEVIPFPSELLDRTDHDFLAAPGMLFAAPRPPGGRLIAIDVASGRKIWDSDRPLKVGVPLLHGRTIYLLERAPFTGAPPASTPLLTLRAIDPATGETRRSLVLEAADRKDLPSHILLQPVPTLHVLADRLAVRSFRQAPGEGPRWTAISLVDAPGLSLAGHLEIPDLPALGGRPTFLGDRVITQLFSGARWRLASIGFKEKKLLWETPWTSGRLHDIHDDAAWFSEPGSDRLAAVDLQSGRIHDKFGIALEGSVVADVTETCAVLFQEQKEPRRVRGVELRTGLELWSLPMPPKEELRFLLRTGHRLFISSPQGSLRCFDLNARKEAWAWTGSGNGPIQHPVTLGDGLVFLKGGRMTRLDLETGLARWEMKGPWTGLKILGRDSLLAGADLIRPRTLPPGSRFVGPRELPLRYSMGDELWNPPAFSGDLLYTVSSRGKLNVIDLKTRTLLWELPVSTIPLSARAGVSVHGILAIVTLGQEAQWIDLEGKKRIHSARHSSPVGGAQVPLGPSGFVLSTPAGLSCLDAEGREVWPSPLRPVVATAASPEAIAVLAAGSLHVLSLKDGATRWTVPAPTHLKLNLLAFDGKTAVCADGPWSWCGPDEKGELTVRFQTRKARSPGPFRGQLALHEGRVYYAHADDELSCFEAGSGKPLWSVKTSGSVGSLLIHGTRLWYRDNGLHGIDLATGKSEWTRDRRDAEAWTPLLRENRVVWWSSEGWLIEPE